MAHSAKTTQLMAEVRDMAIALEGKKIELYMSLKADAPTVTEAQAYRREAEQCMRLRDRMALARMDQVHARPELAGERS